MKVKLRHTETLKVSKKITSHTSFPGNYHRPCATKMTEQKRKKLVLAKQETEHRKEAKSNPTTIVKENPRRTTVKHIWRLEQENEGSRISIFRKINGTDKLSHIFDNVENSDIEN